MLNFVRLFLYSVITAYFCYHIMNQEYVRAILDVQILILMSLNRNN